MARYFEQFPLMLYDIKANGYYKLVPDIFRRVKARNKIKENVALLDVYDVEDTSAGNKDGTSAGDARVANYEIAWDETNTRWICKDVSDPVNNFRWDASASAWVAL